MFKKYQGRTNQFPTAKCGKRERERNEQKEILKGCGGRTVGLAGRIWGIESLMRNKKPELGISLGCKRTASENWQVTLETGQSQFTDGKLCGRH